MTLGGVPPSSSIGSPPLNAFKLAALVCAFFLTAFGPTPVGCTAHHSIADGPFSANPAASIPAPPRRVNNRSHIFPCGTKYISSGTAAIFLLILTTPYCFLRTYHFVRLAAVVSSAVSGTATASVTPRVVDRPCRISDKNPFVSSAFSRLILFLISIDFGRISTKEAPSPPTAAARQRDEPIFPSASLSARINVPFHAPGAGFALFLRNRPSSTFVAGADLEAFAVSGRDGA